MRKIKVAHLSDIHYCAKYLAEVDKVMRAAVASAIEAKCDLAVISGDSSDEALGAHSPAFRALAKQIVFLAEKMPVVMLQGTFSHEAPGMLQMLGMLDTVHPVFIASEVGEVSLTRSGRFVRSSVQEDHLCRLALLPSINKAETFGAGYGAKIKQILADFNKSMSAARSMGVPTILVSHGTIAGCVTESCSVLNGSDHEYGIADIFSAGATATFLGHIHLHQSWSNGTWMAAFAGSLGRLHHGEKGDKGWLLWDIDANTASFEFMKSPIREMIEVVFDGVPDMAEVARIAATANGAPVKLRFAVDEEFAASVPMAQIKALFSDGQLVIDRTLAKTERRRCEGIASMTDAKELLARWAGVNDLNSVELLREFCEIETAQAEIGELV
jgi:DNA repair protein SbcD/Mre11